MRVAPLAAVEADAQEPREGRVVDPRGRGDVGGRRGLRRPRRRGASVAPAPPMHRFCAVGYSGATHIVCKAGAAAGHQLIIIDRSAAASTCCSTGLAAVLASSCPRACSTSCSARAAAATAAARRPPAAAGRAEAAVESKPAGSRWIASCSLCAGVWVLAWAGRLNGAGLTTRKRTTAAAAGAAARRGVGRLLRARGGRAAAIRPSSPAAAFFATALTSFSLGRCASAGDLPRRERARVQQADHAQLRHHQLDAVAAAALPAAPALAPSPPSRDASAARPSAAAAPCACGAGEDLKGGGGGGGGGGVLGF